MNRESEALDRSITGNYGEDFFTACLADPYEEYDITPVCQVGNCPEDAEDGVLCEEHLAQSIAADEESEQR